MRKTKFNFILIVISFILLFSSNFQVLANSEKVYIGGFPAGFIINTEGAEVVGICDVFTGDEIISPSKQAGVAIGDIVVGLNGFSIKGALDIESALKNYSGISTNITVIRSGQKFDLVISPAKETGTGKYKIGLFIRDSMTGIGTMTFIKQTDLRFGALGHPVLNQNNELVKIENSEVYLCSIIGVNKGLKGKPGELRGLFIKEQIIGVADKNTSSGIFGYFNEKSSILTEDKLIDVGLSTAKPGKAKILTTISGTEPKEYNINIVKVDKNDKQNKNLVIKITDQELLKETGGILQGMSGSPIIQNGKLIGAVTHVFINDPTRGFGILIDKMINE
jgi:stage IV sporulation protein B